MIRLAAIDLDDTLINHDLTIAEENKAAIAQAREQGVIVTIATGRMHQSARPYAEQLQLPADQPIITYNGAMTRTVGGELLNHFPVAEDVVLDVIAQAERDGWTLNLYYDDDLFVGQMDSHVRDYEVLSGVPAKVVGPLAEFFHSGHNEISKMLVIGSEDETAERLVQLRNSIGSRAEVVRSRPKFIEITAKGADKGAALERLATSLGISAEEVLAVGDSANDLAMFRYAGTSVAMGNARDEIKAAAQYTTVTNEEAGVAEALRRFCK